MKRIIVNGGKVLTGEIKISGAKNSAVALVPASILSDGVVKIDNIPNVSDIDALIETLEYLGAKVTRNNDYIEIDGTNIINKEIPESLSKKLRASYYFMGSLLGKFNFVEMYFPGGCSIGTRPIDQTLKAFKLLGANIVEKDNKYTIQAKKLVGNHIYLDMPSVGATINTLLAAVRAEGVTILENAAKEPEVVNVATYLNNMGAKISGAGTSEIKIIGVTKLDGCFSEVIPDRIEAGTYTILGALVGKELKISNIITDHIESLLSKLKEMGIPIIINDDSLIISSVESLKPVEIKTLGYPGFPTDLQQPLTTLLTQCNGTSILEETIYENRFKNVPYLNEMGANIEKVSDRIINVIGPTKLVGKEVNTTDLRAGACMLLAALKAEGTTIINNCEHILRGYENLISKLTGVGADIKITDVEE